MKSVDEWSREFDILYSNITSNQAPGLLPYEKSKFLTRAQEAVVVMIYNGTVRNSFEETEEMTVYLDPLVAQKSCAVATGIALPKVSSSSKIYKLPDDLFFRTLELCKLNDPECGLVDAIVVPVTQDEYWRTSRNPFKGSNKRRVLRLSYGESKEQSGVYSDTGYSELVSDIPIASYTVRYIKRPEPIILEDLSADGFSINGETAPKTCKLHEGLHQMILIEAVKAAKAVWAS